MNDWFHDLITDPLRKDHRAFGMAGGAERTGLAGEGQKVFIMALIAADACKPMSEDAAIQIPEEDLLCDGSVVAELALISIGIDIFQTLTVVFD